MTGSIVWPEVESPVASLYRFLSVCLDLVGKWFLQAVLTSLTSIVCLNSCPGLPDFSDLRFMYVA